MYKKQTYLKPVEGEYGVDDEKREMTEALVAARAKFTQERKVTAADLKQTKDGAKRFVMEYFFSTVDHDISFGVEFIPQVEAKVAPAKPVELIKKTQVRSHQHPVWGDVKAEAAGTIVFTWDNSYSYFRKKVLKCSLTAVDPSEDALVDDNPDALAKREADDDPNQNGGDQPKSP